MHLLTPYPKRETRNGFDCKSLPGGGEMLVTWEAVVENCPICRCGHVRIEMVSTMVTDLVMKTQMVVVDFDYGQEWGGPFHLENVQVDSDTVILLAVVSTQKSEEPQAKRLPDSFYGYLLSALQSPWPGGYRWDYFPETFSE